MLHMASFGTILDNLRSKAAQMLQLVSFGKIFNHFGLMQIGSFWTKLDDTHERYSVWNPYRRKPRNVYGIAFVGIIYSVWHRFCCV